MELGERAIALISSSSDSTTKVWQVSAGQEIRTIRKYSSYVLSIAISPDGQTLVSGSGSSGDSTIKVWQLSTGQELRSLTGHSGYVYSLAISPDGQTMISGSGDSTIKIWRVL